MESGNGSETTKNTTKPPEANGAAKKDGKKLKSRSSSSSTSDDSFDEDFFLLDEGAQRKSSVGPGDLIQFDENGKLVSSSDVASLGHTPPDLSAPTPDSDLSPNSAKQSPKIQVMERPEDTDQYRIPSTVFARTQSTAPVEWSVASNESLFSIHMGGHNSFSRDQMILMSKSQELGRPDDMFKFPNATSVDPIVNTSSPATPKSTTTSPAGLVVAEAAPETNKDILRVNDDDKDKTPADGVRVSDNVSPRSSGSGGSVVSFAFPILTKDGTKNASVKMQPESMSKKKKVEPEPEHHEQQQQSQPQTPVSVPNAGAPKWFPCFSCSFCR